MRLAAMLVTAALTAVLVPMVAVVTAAPAYACDCVTRSEAEHFQSAEAVFAGTLVDRAVSQSGKYLSSRDPVTLTFEVSRVYKGDVGAIQDIQTVRDGMSCGIEVEGTGPHLVFAHEDPSRGDNLRAGLCGGGRPLAAGEELAFGPGTAPPGKSTTPEAKAAPAQPLESSAPSWLVPVLALAGIGLAAAVGATLLLGRKLRKSAN